ncbi:hypothetical protein [Agromyces albus]|uniref:hypothetical protein n=1 Tax=Agromyces albus TaxID=205332 RepID=UPI0027D7A4DD|nr:hypothetical protein [Agromyces albus]
MLSLAAAGAIALALSGCTGAPGPTPTPSASTDTAEPIFASDEEALAAAEASYVRYLEVVDKLTQDGGSDPDRVRDVATPAYAVELLDSLQRLRESGNHTVGATRYEDMRLIERGESDGSAKVSVYLCLDVSDIRVVNAGGSDVTPADRAARAPIQAQFESSANNSAELLPSGSESWSGDDFC